MNVSEAVIYREGLESEIKEYLDLRIKEFKKATGLNIDNIKIDIEGMREEGKLEKYSFVYSVEIDVRL
jgi:hypothetical protein